MVHRILVGGYTDSVSVLSFDPSAASNSKASLRLSSITKIGQNPSWVSKHPKRNDLALATLEGVDGRVVLLKINLDGDGEGEVEVLQTVSTKGADPCHVEWLEDEVVISNYSGTNIIFIPYTLNSSSLILNGSASKTLSFEGTGPCTARQEKSHPHQAYMHPTGRELLVPDLGADRIGRLVKDTDGGWKVKGSIEFEKGGGPRHVVVHDDILYTVGELTATLHAHTLPPLSSDSRFQPVFIDKKDTLQSPLPAGNLEWLPAEILLYPTPPSSGQPSEGQEGPLIFVSNRNEPHPEGDTIAIFTLSSSPSSSTSSTPAKSGKLKKLTEIRTNLRSLRGMIFSPDGKYLVVGGQSSGGVVIFEVVITREESSGGVELKEIARLEGNGVEKPTSFTWLI